MITPAMEHHFNSVENEVVKASEYIENHRFFVNEIKEFCVNDINENVIRNYSFEEFETLILDFTNKFNNELQRLLAIKIIIEFTYRFYNTKNFKNIHQCLTKMEIVINKKISKFLYIDTKPESDRKSHHFGSGLAWIILEVYDEPIEYFNSPLEDISPLNTSNFEKINWLGNERLIPYLFDELRRQSLVSNKNTFSIISSHFTVNGKEIKRENIKSNYNSSGIREKSSKDKTIDMKTINEIVDKIKELNKILSNL